MEKTTGNILTRSSSLRCSASPYNTLVLQFALWVCRIAQQAIEKAEAGDYSEVRRGLSFRKPGLALGCVVVVVEMHFQIICDVCFSDLSTLIGCTIIAAIHLLMAS